MRKFLFAVFFLCGLSASAQIYLPITPTTYGEHVRRLRPDSALHIPEKDSLYKLTTDTSAQIFLNKLDSSVWAYSKARGFFKVSGSTPVISDSAWSLNLNSNASGKALGTSNDNDLVFKRNGYEVGRFVHKELDINNMYLPLNNTDSTGIIYKVHSGYGKVPFIYNFEKPGTNGDNLFGGLLSGNLSLTGSSGSQGSYNTGWGSATLYSLTTGFKNTAVGTYALQGNTTGWNNTAMGNNALKNQSTSYNNTGIGIRALGIGVITGSSNTAMAVDALAFNTGGSFNQAFGIDALYQNTNGSYNSAFGDSTFWIHTTGIKNTAIGSRAGYYLGDTYPNFGSVKDSFCTFLGADATRDSSISNATALNNLTVIGYNAKGTASNQVVLGNDDVTSTILKGQIYAPYLNSGVGTKALRYNPGTGLFTYADTTTSSTGTVSSIATNTGTGITGGTITTTGTLALDTAYVVLSKYKAGQTYLPLAGGTMSGVINMGDNAIKGGTTTTSDLTLMPTSGAGTTGADIIFKNGNNGAKTLGEWKNDGILYLGNSGDYAGTLYLRRSSDGTAIGKIAAGSSALVVESAGGIIDFNTSGGSTVRNNSGFWNFGSTSTVSGERVIITGSGATSATYALKVHNSTGTNNALVVRNDGKVGIGVNNPDSLLHVKGGGALFNGSIKVSKNVNLDSTLTVGGAHVNNVKFISDADYTILSSDYIISTINWGGDHTITLPVPSTDGRILKFVSNTTSGTISFNSDIIWVDGSVISSTTPIIGQTASTPSGNKVFSCEMAWNTSGGKWVVIDAGNW